MQNKHPKNKKLALKLGIQTYQILTNDDEVCIPSLSSILLAVPSQTGCFVAFLEVFLYFEMRSKINKIVLFSSFDRLSLWKTVNSYFYLLSGVHFLIKNNDAVT